MAVLIHVRQSESVVKKGGKGKKKGKAYSQWTPRTRRIATCSKTGGKCLGARHYTRLNKHIQRHRALTTNSFFSGIALVVKSYVSPSPVTTLSSMPTIPNPLQAGSFLFQPNTDEIIEWGRQVSIQYNTTGQQREYATVLPCLKSPRRWACNNSAALAHWSLSMLMYRALATCADNTSVKGWHHEYGARQHKIR